MDDEQVTFTELGRRWGVSQQRVSQLAQDPTFPAHTRVGPAYQVSWRKAEAWMAARTRRPGRPKADHG